MIEYIDEIHTYLLDGVILPSVSQVLHETIFKDKYKGVPSYILNRKAEYGTTIHKAVELFEINRISMLEKEALYVTIEETKLNYIQEKSINEYLKLKRKYNINVVEQEKIVHYKNLYAGRFDMIAEINNELCLCDIKTTAELDEEYLSYQLSMYELAYGKKFKRLYAIWLPKGKLGKLVEIKRKGKNEILKLFETEKGEKNEI